MTTVFNIIGLIAVSGMFIFHILSVIENKKYRMIYTALAVISHALVIAPILYFERELSLLVMLYMAALALRVAVFAAFGKEGEK